MTATSVPEESPPQRIPSLASIVITNWNGKHHLQRNLQSVLDAAKEFGGPTEIIVVDDASTDGSVDYLRAEFPGTRLEVHPANRGFASACWTGILAARGTVVVLLNNDVRPHKAFLAPLVQHFADESVFAVGALSVSEDNRAVREGVKVPYFKRGLLKFRNARETTSGVAPTFYAVGGHVAYRRDRFVELGGFDPVYSPLYWEDVDISYRAWKRGWRVLFEPQSRVIHEERGDFRSAHGHKPTAIVNHRNRFVFTWVNMTDPLYFYVYHLVPTLIRVMFGFLVMDFDYYRAFFGAVRSLPTVVRCRKQRRRESAVSDREIFNSIVSGATARLRRA